MATQTRSGRMGRTQGQSANRFGRSAQSGGGGGGRFARGTSSPRRSSPSTGLRRRQAKPKGLQKVVKSVLPTGAAKKAAPSGKAGKAGGVALLAAAAGVAFKNRDKIVGQVKQRTSGGSSPAPDGGGTGVNAAPPATPIS